MGENTQVQREYRDSKYSVNSVPLWQNLIIGGEK